MGSTFAGRVNAATSTDATDLINILQKDVNPAISRIMTREVQNKKDEAVQEINQLLTTKDADTVQKEILEGKHPNLNNKYVLLAIFFRVYGFSIPNLLFLNNSVIEHISKPYTKLSS